MYLRPSCSSGGSGDTAHPDASPLIREAGWTVPELDDLLFYGVIGVIAGGRLGQVLFYEPAYYLQHPLEIFAVWQGGMSFHGGFLGVLLAMALYVRKSGRNWLDVTDFIAPLVPLGLATGRIGNFINGELWGRVADPALPWAMIFPHVDPAAASLAALSGRAGRRSGTPRPPARRAALAPACAS
jgi:prolipoprotein diacylglyceryl transferase